MNSPSHLLKISSRLSLTARHHAVSSFSRPRGFTESKIAVARSLRSLHSMMTTEPSTTVTSHSPPPHLQLRYSLNGITKGSSSFMSSGAYRTFGVRQLSTGANSYPSEQRKQDHKHCVEMVQTRDMEGYLCGLLMPSSAREAFFALRAFNVEIASIKDASRLVGGRSRGMNNDDDEMGTDASIGSRLRMQWWRDAITEIYDSMNQTQQQQLESNEKKSDPLLQSLISSRKHNPTLRSLNHAIQTHGLTHNFLRRMMEARERDLDVVQYEKGRDVAQYGEDTVSNVLYLSLECVGVRDEASDMVASDIGVGLGLITALRSTAFRATQGECSIPIDIAYKHSVTMETLYIALNASLNSSGSNADGHNPAISNAQTKEEAQNAKESLRKATKEMAKMASFHLHRARENQGVVPKEGRPCLLPAVCGLQYLSVLEECDYDVFHPSLVGVGEDDGGAASGMERRRRLNLMFLLGRAWFTGTF